VLRRLEQVHYRVVRFFVFWQLGHRGSQYATFSRGTCETEFIAKLPPSLFHGKLPLRLP